MLHRFLRTSITACLLLSSIAQTRAQEWRDRFRALVRFENTANAMLPARAPESFLLEGFWIPRRLTVPLGDWTQHPHLRILERATPDGASSVFFPIHPNDAQTANIIRDWLLREGVSAIREQHAVLQPIRSASRSLYLETEDAAIGLKLSEPSDDPAKVLTRGEVATSISVSRYLTALTQQGRMRSPFIADAVGYALRGLNERAVLLRDYTPLLRRGLLVPGMSELHPNGPLRTQPIVREFLNYPEDGELPRMPRLDHAMRLGRLNGLDMANWIEDTALVPTGPHGQNLLALYERDAHNRVSRSIVTRDMGDFVAIDPLFEEGFRSFRRARLLSVGGQTAPETLRHRPAYFTSLVDLAHSRERAMPGSSDRVRLYDLVRRSATASVEALAQRFEEQTGVRLTLERSRNPVALIPLTHDGLSPWLHHERFRCVTDQIASTPSKR